jgi:hypothetical protein
VLSATDAAATNTAQALLYQHAVQGMRIAGTACCTTVLASMSCYHGSVCALLLLLPAGTRLIFGSTQRSAVQADTLMLPVYIVEDFVRQRLRAKITR